jgi:hypothetical protein
MVGPYDDAFAALGRYVAVFSSLTALMRNLFATRIAGQGGIERELVDYALGALAGEPIADAFFAAGRTLAEFDKAEENIEAALRKAVLSECTRRNDIAHGDWLFDELGEGGGARSVMFRTKASRVSSHPLKMSEYTAQDLRAICGEVESLWSLIYVFAHVVLRPHGDEPLVLGGHESAPARLRDALELVDGRVRIRSDLPHPTWEG